MGLGPRLNGLSLIENEQFKSTRSEGGREIWRPGLSICYVVV